MHPLDFLIALFIIGSLYRGYHIGLVRQAASTAGFVSGILLGSYLARHLISHATGSSTTSLLSILLVLAISFVFMTIGEYFGQKLKAKFTNPYIDRVDGGFGSLMGAATLLFGIWLVAAMLLLSPQLGWQNAIKDSHIISLLNRTLPPAPQLLGTLNRLIDPNGFPKVFSGLEPSPQHVTSPTLSSLEPAIQADRASIVKVEGTGCGGIIEGSGFVYAPGKVATNAHVVAGVAQPEVLDSNGLHNSKVIWFDPNLDLAVLQVSDLAGKPLVLNTTTQTTATPAVVAGYPGGGDFSAQPASILEHFNALGRNIYDKGFTSRQIYSVQAKVIPGNSGGPLLAIDGRVLGVVFATSTTYNNVGYVLTAHQVSSELTQAKQLTTARSTGSCSE